MGGPEKGRLFPPCGARSPLSSLEVKKAKHPIVIQCLSKFDPLPGVTVLVVQDHPEVHASAGVAEAAESDLDQLVLQLKRRTEGNGESQPIPKGGDTPGVHETHLEPVLDQSRTDFENLRHHQKAVSVCLRLVSDATSNVLHDLLHCEERERGK